MITQNKTEKMISEISKVVIGQDEFIRHLLIAFISGGHVLMEGVPGLGKTLTAKALAKTIKADFKRIQFTPDLMPSDVLGTSVFDMKTSEFYIKKGPVFTNVLLADEINRTPPKTQSALLEAMEEKSVTIDGVSHRLQDPFFVIATQNPIEYEGTYPLPEAQLDRFLMKLIVNYIPQEDEDKLLKAYEGNYTGAHAGVETLEQVITPEELAECRDEISHVRIYDGILHYITGITFATRNSPAIMLGASPRASIAMLLCARTAAAMDGRDYVLPEDVVDAAIPILRHRIILRPEAGVEGMTADNALEEVIRKVEIPR